MLVKIEIVDITNPRKHEVKETHYVETDSAKRAMDMFDDSEKTDVRYHIMTPAEERKYYAAKLGSVTSKAKAKSSAANGQKGGRPRKQADR